MDVKDRPTQDEIGVHWGVVWGAEVTQSAISQYFNGTVPINIVAAIRFAPLFGCMPKEILDVPELRDFPKAEQISAKFMWPFGPELKKRYDELDPSEQATVLGAVSYSIAEAERKSRKEVHDTEPRVIQRG